jgi:hypothetical protein
LSDIENTIDIIAERLIIADQQSELGQTFRVFPVTGAVHLDHNVSIAPEYLDYTEAKGKSFGDSIAWPEAAKVRETFDSAEHIGGPTFWVERIRPYVEAGQPFLIQLQVVQDTFCETCQGEDACEGGCDLNWPAWALMIAEAK